MSASANSNDSSKEIRLSPWGRRLPLDVTRRLVNAGNLDESYALFLRFPFEFGCGDLVAVLSRAVTLRSLPIAVAG